MTDALQSQLDQVLALVDQFALTGRANWTHPKREVFANELRSRLSEIRAAVGARGDIDDDKIIELARKHFLRGNRHDKAYDDLTFERHLEFIPQATYNVPTVSLSNFVADCVATFSASPTATVDVGALRELVEKWREAEKKQGDAYQRTSSSLSVDWQAYGSALTYDACADELAALIGEKA